MTKTTKPSAAQLAEALSTAESRAATLNAQLQASQAVEAQAAAAFAANAPGGGDMIKATSSVMSYERSLEVLNRQLDTLRKQLSAAQAEEAHERKLQQIELIVDQGARALAGFERERAELSVLLEERLTRMTALYQQMAQARASFCEAVNLTTNYSLNQLLNPRISGEAEQEMRRQLDQLLHALEQRGCDLSAVLMADFLGGRTAADRPHRWSEIPVTQIVTQIVNEALRTFDGRRAAYNRIENERAGLARSQSAGL